MSAIPSKAPPTSNGTTANAPPGPETCKLALTEFTILNINEGCPMFSRIAKSAADQVSSLLPLQNDLTALQKELVLLSDSTSSRVTALKEQYQVADTFVKKYRDSAPAPTSAQTTQPNSIKLDLKKLKAEGHLPDTSAATTNQVKIGRASCRERVCCKV